MSGSLSTIANEEGVEKKRGIGWEILLVRNISLARVLGFCVNS
jgi:hypothetical protein